MGLALDGEGPLGSRHLDDVGGLGLLLLGLLGGGLDGLLPVLVDGLAVEALLLGLPLAPLLTLLPALPVLLVALLPAFAALVLLLAVLLLLDLLEAPLLGDQTVHLHVLVAGDLVPEAFDDLLGGELLNLVGAGRTGDEVDLGDLEELPEDELPSPVTVDEGGGDPLAGKLLDRLGDVRALDGDGVLYAGLEEVEDIGPALDDDDGLGVLDVGSGGAPVLSVGGDLLDLDALPDAVGEVEAGSLGLPDELVEKFLGTLDDLLPLGHADVLDPQDVDGGLAGSDTVDGLQSGGEDDGLHLVQAGGHVDDTLGFPAFGGDLDLDPADPAGFLQVPEIEFVTEQTLGLTEDGADHIGLLDDSVGVDLRFNHVLRCVWIYIHEHPPGC